MNNSLSLRVTNKLPASDDLIIVPPLDTYTIAHTAFSISRLLRTLYTGNAILVRRSSDGLTIPIGYLLGVLDEVALLNHVGRTASDNGFIVTAYDHTVNGYNWTQATANLQPQIVFGGVVNKLNGKPSMHQTATQYLEALVPDTGTVQTAFHVSKYGRDIAMVNSGGISKFYGALQDGEVSATYSLAGTPLTYVNSTLVNTRDDLHTSAFGIQSILSVTNLNLSGWTRYNTEYTSHATWTGGEELQETIIYNSNKSSDRVNIVNDQNAHFSVY